MKRTTIAPEDDLQRRLKQKAAAEGRTFQEVVNELLRQGLGRKERRREYHLRLEGWEADLQPGIDILDRDKLLDLMARG